MTATVVVDDRRSKQARPRATLQQLLPENLTADPERLARFRREAKVLASLHHPNIAGIFGIEAGAGRAGALRGDQPAGNRGTYVSLHPDGERLLTVSGALAESEPAVLQFVTDRMWGLTR